MLALIALVVLGADLPRAGLDQRPEARAFLGLPADDGKPFPGRLSQADVFRDLRALEPVNSLIPYDLIVPFWSDGATKTRWVSIPSNGPPIRYSADGEWTFPAGTVFVKHFDLSSGRDRRRLETRLLVVGRTGAVRGATYRWRADATEADLVTAPLTEPVRVGTSTQTWTFPGPADCLQCHTPAAGRVLGPKTRQLNRSLRYPSGVEANQLRTWSRLGLFDHPPADNEIDHGIRLASLSDSTRSLEDRARSYLDANCSQCHRPGGVPAEFDARFTTPLARQRLINEPVRINLGIDGARALAPNDPWRSAILGRVETLEAVKMPPLAHHIVDARSAALLREWIASLPGPPTLEPPRIDPPGGDLAGPVVVSILHPDREAVVRYTLDGSPPGKGSTVYSGSFRVEQSTTVRARAYRAGWTRSIATQETFIIGP